MKGVRTSKQRTLRLMREERLLAPGRAQRTLGPRIHDGTITPKRPNVMWGTDATGVWPDSKHSNQFAKVCATALEALRR